MEFVWFAAGLFAGCVAGWTIGSIPRNVKVQRTGKLLIFWVNGQPVHEYRII